MTNERKEKENDSFLLSYAIVSEYKSPLNVRICFVSDALLVSKELKDGSNFSSLHILQLGDAMREVAIEVSMLSWIFLFDFPIYSVRLRWCV